VSNNIYPTVKGLAWTVLKTPASSTIVSKSTSGVTVRIAQMQNPIWTWELIYEYLYDNFVSPNNTMPYSPATDLRELMGFFLARQGQFDDFLFNDPSDNWAGPQTWQARYTYFPGTTIIDPAGHGQLTVRGGESLATIPTFNDSGGSVQDGSILWADQGAFSGATAQTLALVNDGAVSPTYYSPLQRNMGGLFLEDVTDLNTSVNPLRVWANGTPQLIGTCGSSINCELHGPGLAIPGYSYTGMYLKWCAMPTAPITAAFNFYFRVRFKTDDQDFEQFMQGLWTIGGGGGKNGKGMIELVTSRPATA
jgi:hypothetical protein